jgi:hypothetical protein
MVRGAEEHSNIAIVYEKLSANESAPSETRAAFVRKANWHSILARLAAVLPAEKEKAGGGERVVSDTEALLFSPLRLWKAGQTTELRDQPAKKTASYLLVRGAESI